MCFFVINFHASKYDFELIEIFTNKLPFKLNIRWYEANYEIIEEDTKNGIMAANYYFPIDDELNGVYVERILKYCIIDNHLAVNVKTDKNEVVILIKDYNTETGNSIFEFYSTTDFINLHGYSGVFINLDHIPLFVGLWPIIGSVTFFLLVIILISNLYIYVKQ